MTVGTIVIRADGGISLGAGHLMRGIALAEAWEADGGRAILVIGESTPFVDHYISSERFFRLKSAGANGSEQDAARLVEIAREQRVDWVALDGPHFLESYQRLVKDSGVKLLAVDDYGQSRHCVADVLLNQNLLASPWMYEHREPYTSLLLGTDYVMLRKEFPLRQSPHREFRPNPCQILVTLGGTDPDGLTLGVVKGLLTIADSASKILVVVCGNNPQIAELKKLESESARIKLVIDARDIPQIMARSDLAIIIGGGTLWECLYMGTPTLSFCRHGLQQQVIEKLSALGIVYNLGPAVNFEAQLVKAINELVASPSRRKSMSELGRAVVDGRGPARVVEVLRSSSL